MTDKTAPSVLLANLHHAYAQTDGTYKFPNSREGDILKRAKKEVEELRAVLASAGAQAKDATQFLQPDDLDDLKRIDANFEDGEGYMASKDVMNRLAELGVIGSSGFGSYFITAFGSWLLEQAHELPLRTVGEHNRREQAGFELYNKDGFDGTAWVNLPDGTRHEWRERAAIASGKSGEVN